MIRVMQVGPEDRKNTIRVMDKEINALFKKNIIGMKTKDLAEKLKTNRMEMWLIADDMTPKAIAFTEIQDLKQGPKLYIPYISGKDMHLWLDDFLDEMKQYGAFMGCKKFGAVIRKGIARKFNLKPKYYVVEMDTEHG